MQLHFLFVQWAWLSHWLSCKLIPRPSHFLKDHLCHKIHSALCLLRKKTYQRGFEVKGRLFRVLSFPRGGGHAHISSSLRFL